MFEVSFSPAYEPTIKCTKLEIGGSPVSKFSKVGEENKGVFLGISTLENLLKNDQLFFSTISDFNTKKHRILDLLQKYIEIDDGPEGTMRLLEQGFTFKADWTDIEKEFVMMTRTNFRSFFTHLLTQPTLIKKFRPQHYMPSSGIADKSTVAAPIEIVDKIQALAPPDIPKTKRTKTR